MKRGDDAGIMPLISSANIACGFHGGDVLTIQNSILLALQYGVAIGAHPGYPDLEGFGRKDMDLTREELYALILYQVSAVKGMAEALGGRLRHVKAHGALYNKAAKDYDTALVLALAVRDIDPSLVFVGLSGSQSLLAAEKLGLATASEVFADRAYADDATLVPRSLPGSVLHNTDEICSRALRMIQKSEVESLSGKLISIKADTICIHGDHEGAAELAAALRKAISEAGIEIKPCSNVV